LGRNVVILPDNDAEGRKHTEAVARSLQGKAASIKVVSLPDLPEKGDVSDWLDAGGTVDQLKRLISTAPPWVPFSVVTDDPGPARFQLTDMGNGERLIHAHGRDLRYVHPWSKWLVWDEKRWVVDNTAAVVQRAKQAVRDIYREAAEATDDEAREKLAKHALSSENRHRVESMIWSAAREPSKPVLPAALDVNPWLLNCPNGTIDLTTGELREHRRADLITRLCPAVYDPSARAPLWESTLNRIFAGDSGLIGFWRRLCGLILTGCVDEQILPIPYGSGANGKSTVLNGLLEVLGSDYAMKAPPALLMVKRSDAHPTEQAALFGKRLVVAIETGEGARINEVLVKELTGGDPITARRMREDFWTFKPTHKVLLCTNHKPAVRGTDHAIWRRLRIVPFTVTIPEAEQDKALPRKLLEQLPGILAWCVRGCLEWQQDGLNPPPCVIDATEQYRQDEDVLGAFLAEHCLENPELRVKGSTLFARFKVWAEGSAEPCMTQRKFGMAMTERGFERYTNDGTWYRGLGLRQTETDDNRVPF
jgi:putative DNA primase/helicase